MHANFLPFPAAAFLLAFPGAALAQVVPTTPTKFSIKPVGNPTASTGATINRNQKSYEVPLDRLAAEEQKFIKDLQTAIAAKP